MSCFAFRHGSCRGRVDRHHLVKQQVIRKQLETQRYKAGLIRLEKGAMKKALADERNIVPMCRLHHDQFHGGNLTITRAEIPEDAETFAAELGLVWFLDRVYGELEAAA